jgi:hypothetical protein
MAASCSVLRHACLSPEFFQAPDLIAALVSQQTGGSAAFMGGSGQAKRFMSSEAIA